MGVPPDVPHGNVPLWRHFLSLPAVSRKQEVKKNLSKRTKMAKII